MPAGELFDYELIDFGRGRKLERFGERVVDRPAQVALDAVPSHPQRWDGAGSRYEARRAAAGEWVPANDARWQVQAGTKTFELRLTETGQLGLFPEQAGNWEWIRAQCREGELRVLNLFAYTGASTLAAAEGSASVVHVDAAGSVVAWARRNAELSGMSERPIRWITEDAHKFVSREVKRGNRYEGIVLDPPSYGHGPSGQVWKFESDIEPLLADCAKLLSERARFVLLTCHTTGWTDRELQAMLARHLPAGNVQCGSMELMANDGRKLESGAFARWTSA